MANRLMPRGRRLVLEPGEASSIRDGAADSKEGTIMDDRKLTVRRRTFLQMATLRNYPWTNPWDRMRSSWVTR